MTDKLRAEISTKEAQKALQQLEQRIESLSNAFVRFTKEAENFQGAGNAFSEFAQKATQAASAMQEFSGAVKNSRANISALTKSIATLSTKLNGLKASANGAFGAFAVPDRNVLKGISTSATNLGRALASIPSGTTEIVTSLERIGAAAMKAKTGLIQMAKAANQIRKMAIDLKSVAYTLEVLAGKRLNLANIDVSALEKLSTSAKGLNELGNNASTNAQKLNLLQSVLDSLAQSESRFAQTLYRTGTAFQQMTAKLYQLFPALRQFSDLLKAAAFGASAFISVKIVQAIAEFTAGIWKAYRGVQAFKNAMMAVTGSYDKTAESLEFVKEVSFDLGLSLESTAKGFRQFTVAAGFSGVKTEDASRAFKQMSEVLTVLHADAGQTSRAFLALEQMFSKGKVSSEELRRQLGEVIPGAMNIFAESLGVTTEQLDGMLRRGEVTAKAILPFIDLLSQKFSGGLNSALNSSVVAFGRLGNAVEQLQLAVGTGFFDQMVSSINMLAYAVKGTGIQQFGELLGRVASIAVNVFVTSIAAVLHVLNALGYALIPINTAFQVVFNATGKVLHEIVKIGQNIQDNVVGAFEDLANSGTVVGTVLRGIARAFELVGVGIKAFTSDITKTTREMTTFERVVDAIGYTFQFMFGGVMTGLFLRGLFRFVKGMKVVKIATDAFKKSLKEETGVLFKLIQNVNSLGTALFTLPGILGLVRGAFAALMGFVTAHPWMAMTLAILAVASAVTRFQSTSEKARKETVALQMTVTRAAAAFDAGVISVEQYKQALLGLGASPPALETFLKPEIFGGYADKIKQIAREMSALGQQVGMNAVQAKGFGLQIANLIGITNGWYQSIGQIRQALRNQLQIINQGKEAIKLRIAAILQEIAVRKRLGLTYGDLNTQLKQLIGVYQTLNNRGAMLSAQLGDVGPQIEKIKQLKEELAGLSEQAQIKFKLALGEGDIAKLQQIINSLSSTQKQLEGLKVSSSGLKELLSSIGDYISNALNIGDKAAQANASMRQFSSNVQNSVNNAVASIERWNNTPMLDKHATVTITRVEKTVKGAAQEVAGYRTGGYFPKFAEGTANTNRYPTRLATGGDGGFPAILHHGEAVVPLSRGRFIPVELNINTPVSYARDKYNTGGTTQNNSGGATIGNLNLHINIVTQDADSFERSKHQIYQDLQRNIIKTVRTVG